MGQIVDLETFRENIDHDTAMEQMLLNLYLEGSDEAMRRLEHRVAAGTITEKQWEDDLHFLQGAALNIAAGPFAEQLRLAYETPTTYEQKKQLYTQIAGSYTQIKRIIEQRMQEFT